MKYEEIRGFGKKFFGGIILKKTKEQAERWKDPIAAFFGNFWSIKSWTPCQYPGTHGMFLQQKRSGSHQ
ncbi:MAG: hypothetical protein WC342_09080 [Methanoregula sp.]